MIKSFRKSLVLSDVKARPDLENVGQGEQSAFYVSQTTTVYQASWLMR